MMPVNAMRLRAASASGPIVSAFFQTHTYTGDGSAPRDIPGVDLTGGGFSWFNNMNGDFPHGPIISSTGSSPIYLVASDPADGVAADASLLSSGTRLTTTQFNVNAYDYINFSAKKAANFVDIIPYSGNSTNRTVSHALGCDIGMLMVKSVAGGGGYNWQMRHKDMANTSYMQNASAMATGATRWNSSAMGSSTFPLGTAFQVNLTGEDYIAIAFAHDTSPSGVIQAFSYVGNGGASGPDVILGWQPQFIILLRATGSDFQVIYNNVQTPGFTGADSKYSYVVGSGVSASNDDIELISGGFRAKAGVSNAKNVNAVQYYGIAIRG